MKYFNKVGIGIVALIVVISISFILLTFNKHAYNEYVLAKYCRTTFEQTGKCPEDKCETGCGLGGQFNEGGCPIGCNPKPCIAFTSETCPLESCQIITNCKGEEICYYKLLGQPPECGGISYYGQDVACCDGLVKRCGLVLADGSCDNTQGGYNNLPHCLPCGNSVCDQFENICSCPEDCKHLSFP